MFERETRREKILEARNKELRLKEKTKGILNLGGGGGLMSGIGGSGGGGGGEKGEEGKEGGSNKFGKAALVAVSTPTIGGEDKKDAKRIEHLVKSDTEKSGEGDETDGKKAGKKEEEEETEDPIVKAEREFFEIIKAVRVQLQSAKSKLKKIY